MDKPTKFDLFPLFLMGLLLAACQQVPSVSEVQEACQRANATILSVEFGKAFTSTEPERTSGLPPNVTIYPVTVTYQLPSISGSDSRQSVGRYVYRNFADELVCD